MKILRLFWSFFVISAVTLGGGLAMLPVMKRDFVEKQKWLTSDEMVDVISVTQSLPGIISTNMAVLVGYRTAGILGALASTIGVILPPFIAIMVVTFCLSSLNNTSWLDKIFLGVRACVSALILLAAIDLGKKIVRSWQTATLAIVSFLVIVIFRRGAIAMIFAGAVLGIINGVIRRRLAKTEGADAK